MRSVFFTSVLFFASLSVSNLWGSLQRESAEINEAATFTLKEADLGAEPLWQVTLPDVGEKKPTSVQALATFVTMVEGWNKSPGETAVLRWYSVVDLKGHSLFSEKGKHHGVLAVRGQIDQAQDMTFLEAQVQAGVIQAYQSIARDQLSDLPGFMEEIDFGGTGRSPSSSLCFCIIF